MFYVPESSKPKRIMTKKTRINTQKNIFVPLGCGDFALFSKIDLRNDGIYQRFPTSNFRAKASTKSNHRDLPNAFSIASSSSEKLLGTPRNILTPLTKNTGAFGSPEFRIFKTFSKNLFGDFSKTRTSTALP